MLWEFLTFTPGKQALILMAATVDNAYRILLLHCDNSFFGNFTIQHINRLMDDQNQASLKAKRIRRQEKKNMLQNPKKKKKLQYQTNEGGEGKDKEQNKEHKNKHENEAVRRKKRQICNYNHEEEKQAKRKKVDKQQEPLKIEAAVKKQHTRSYLKRKQTNTVSLRRRLKKT